jgi:hypothetical protein
MKNLLLLFSLCSSFVLSAQNTVPDYFASNPRWVERMGDDTYVQLFLEGDTLVGGKQYHKLMASGDDVSGYDEREGVRLQGLIRQEGRKVFYRGFVLFFSEHNYSYPIKENTPLPNKEFMLFDFGLELGDTLYVADNPLFRTYLERFPEDNAFVVNQISSNRKFYPNSFASVIRLNSVIQNTWLEYYEGVASEHTFISEMFAYQPNAFNCYKNDSSDMVDPMHRYYVDGPRCDFVTSIENESEPYAPTVYPLPSQGVLNFSEPVNAYTVYNARGQEVITSNKISQQINITHLPNGLYFLHYTYGQRKSAVQKVVLSK